MINPQGGDRLTPAEEALYGTIDKWNGPQDFDTIKAMRTNIGDATNTAFRSGDSRAGRRLLTVRDGLDASIENAVDARASAEQTAVQAGALNPNDAMAGKLSDEVAAWRSNRGQRPGAAMGVSGQGNAGPVPQRETAIPGAPGTAGQTLQGAAVPTGGEGLAQPLSPVADRYRVARAYTRETHGIFDQTPAGAVIARGPYGAPEKLPDSLVVRQFLNGKATEPEAIRNFEAATGGRPEAISALHDAALFDLRRTAVDNSGQLNPTAFKQWTKAHEGILSIYPELQQKIGSIADAQRDLNAVQAQRKLLTKQFEDSAAKHWLGGTDPITAVTNAMSKRAGNDPAQNVKEIMGLAGNDPAAQAGVKRALRDWLVTRGISGKEAGQTGTNWIRTQTMQDLVKQNRPALAQAFSPEEMNTLDTLATSLQQADRSISGSKPPIGPGTARDLMASKRYGAATQSLLGVLRRGAFRVGAMALGAHFAGTEGLVGSIVGSDALHELAGASGAGREDAIKNLIIDALASPPAMRTLLAHATPTNIETLTQQLARRLAQSAATATVAR